MPGPAGNPNARRRNARVGVQMLPAEGRQGPPPAWPAMPKPSKAEADTWRYLWGLPHAAMWDKLRMHRVVARYARLLVAAESSADGLAAAGECRQMEDRLGLSPKAMRGLLWDIPADEVAERRTEQAPAAPRRRLKVAGGDAVVAD